ncbi:Gfo/Idh/MocA family oxidoreductase [Erwinia phyllosphaerae]|uniref:Gfo/Idh/MocA family oxidoreductase n=1 Tax=Erwinia phyllosphaerae TaxID=2853256 RepID=UPI001FEE9768|nr:Gfo/Idh/MocA family oxidoreductase [Erwinia phyllosphaerae]MBV4366336.1 Gfo/Idh/MocA family oxidoreductase [Erwinia phyllosphaerae]
MTFQKPPVRVGLIGAGRMGSFHAENLAWRVPGATLAAVADPQPGAAAKLAEKLGVEKAYSNLHELLMDAEIDAVVIASPARTHAEWVIAAVSAGKHVFCEKPMAVTLDEADRAIAAAKGAGVVLQVGFNRRFDSGFAAAIAAVKAGENGTTQLSRSVTRDPALRDPAPIPQWTIFLETLIHDFDTLLHFNYGAKPVEVYALADALVRPDFKDKGLLDTSVVTIRFDNGAIATAEANFQAVYGYDVRGEVFGSKGMLQAGHINATNCVRYHADGIAIETSRMDSDLLREAYVMEMIEFARCIRTGETPRATGEDARNALEIALACIESVKHGQPVKLGGR